MLSRLSIRWRLALTSAALTFAILCAFAIVVGQLTQRRIRQDFRDQLGNAAEELRRQIVIEIDSDGGRPHVRPNLEAYAAPENAAIRVLTYGGNTLRQTKRIAGLRLPRDGHPRGRQLPRGDPALDPRLAAGQPVGQVYVQYARRVSDLDATLGRVRLFLLLGVLGGTGLALVAGSVLARRAMPPIAELTATAREIGAHARPPRRRARRRTATTRSAELARTLDEMLQALQASRAETEAALDRQRQFVADASHELRTPLTSVLANLELLAEALDGERGEAAESALRSSQRMRRLVADLLLLARADARRTVPRQPTDLGQVVVDAAAELEPVAGDHELEVEAEPARRRRRPRRAAPPGAQPDGERDQAHAAGHARPRDRDRGRRHGAPRRRGRRPRRAARRCATASSSASCAARATPAGRSAWGCRSSAPSPSPTAAPSGSRTAGWPRGALRRHPAARRCGRTTACSRQTSTTTGSTIGRRLSRS